MFKFINIKTLVMGFLAIGLHLPLFAQSIPNSHMEVIDEVTRLMQQHHYNPAELKSAEFHQVLGKMKSLGKQDITTEEFVDQFNAIWQNGPFSHVRMSQASQQF